MIEKLGLNPNAKGHDNGNNKTCVTTNVVIVVAQVMKTMIRGRGPTIVVLLLFNVKMPMLG